MTLVAGQARHRGRQALLVRLTDWQQAPERAEARIPLDSPAARGASAAINATGQWRVDLNTEKDILNQEVVDGIVRRGHGATSLFTLAGAGVASMLAGTPPRQSSH